MRRVSVCAAALALVAGGSLAAPSPEVPAGTTHHSGQPTLSGEWSAGELGLPVAEEAATEVFEVAGKRGRGGGRRGGANRKNRGGFNNGNRRNDNRHRDRDVDFDVDHHDDDYGDAIVGGVIGIGIGAAIANSNDPDYVCVDENADGECDY